MSTPSPAPSAPSLPLVVRTVPLDDLASSPERDTAPGTADVAARAADLLATFPAPQPQAPQET